MLSVHGLVIKNVSIVFQRLRHLQDEHIRGSAFGRCNYVGGIFLSLIGDWLETSNCFFFFRFFLMQHRTPKFQGKVQLEFPFGWKVSFTGRRTSLGDPMSKNRVSRQIHSTQVAKERGTDDPFAPSTKRSSNDGRTSESPLGQACPANTISTSAVAHFLGQMLLAGLRVYFFPQKCGFVPRCDRAQGTSIGTRIVAVCCFYAMSAN